MCGEVVMCGEGGGAACRCSSTPIPVVDLNRPLVADHSEGGQGSTWEDSTWLQQQCSCACTGAGCRSRRVHVQRSSRRAASYSVQRGVSGEGGGGRVGVVL